MEIVALYNHMEPYMISVQIGSAVTSSYRRKICYYIQICSLHIAPPIIFQDFGKHELHPDEESIQKASLNHSFRYSTKRIYVCFVTTRLWLNRWTSSSATTINNTYGPQVPPKKFQVLLVHFISSLGGAYLMITLFGIASLDTVILRESSCPNKQLLLKKSVRASCWSVLSVYLWQTYYH